jgi:hypothetical protein
VAVVKVKKLGSLSVRYSLVGVAGERTFSAYFGSIDTEWLVVAGDCDATDAGLGCYDSRRVTSGSQSINSALNWDSVLTTLLFRSTNVVLDAGLMGTATATLVGLLKLDTQSRNEDSRFAALEDGGLVDTYAPTFDEFTAEPGIYYMIWIGVSADSAAAFGGGGVFFVGNLESITLTYKVFEAQAPLTP